MKHTFLGKREAWDKWVPFGLSAYARAHHVYVIGKTGVGKSTLLENILIQDIDAGYGVGFIDPHGDLAEAILEKIPPHRIDDVLYFNLADGEFPIGLNPLRVKGESTVGSIVGAFKNIWRDSWGPRMHNILSNTIAALAECENTSLLGIQRMLLDVHYREWVLRQVKDPMVRYFWEREFVGHKGSFTQEAIAPILNKVGQLFLSPTLRNVLYQLENRVDARFLMDNRRILIVNLAKGKIGEEWANLIGSLLVSQFQNAAFSREDIPAGKRHPFHLLIDEFHNFTTEAFASILSESRKYGLHLTLAHQYSKQLPERVLDGILGNVGSILAFRVGSHDAKLLAEEFGGEYIPTVFTELPRHRVAVKLMQEGEAVRPFVGKTLPPLPLRYGGKDNVIRRSRERHATKRAIVEADIRRSMGR